MKPIFKTAFTIVMLVSLCGCALRDAIQSHRLERDLQVAQTKCEKIGFVPGTADYKKCMLSVVENENLIREQRRAERREQSNRNQDSLRDFIDLQNSINLQNSTMELQRLQRSIEMQELQRSIESLRRSR